MPIHLNLVSRRSFLGTSSLLALTPAHALLGAENGNQSWALLSDTHIAADRSFEPRNRKINMADRLSQVVGEVLAEKDSLAGVIINGDCAFDDGQPGDYTTLIELLKPLTDAGIAIHCTLGNHDNRDTFYDASLAAAKDSSVASKHCSVIETPLADWVLLDTLRFVNKVEGELGEAQINWLKQRLAKSPEKPAILVGHHYPQEFRTDVIPGDQEIKISGLVDSDRFFQLIADHSSAKAYIYGHSHNWQVKEDEHHCHHINLPPTAHLFDPSRPAGWVRATVQPEGLKLELRALDPSHPEHGEIHALSWR